MARFVDTNILVYAEDLDAGDKRERASALIKDRWNQGDGAVSVQVLREFHVTVTRKLPRPMTARKAETIVREYLTWRTVGSDSDLLRPGMVRSRSSRLTLWDAVIVEAAIRAGCDRLHTEELTHGQHFARLEVAKPFHP